VHYLSQGLVHKDRVRNNPFLSRLRDPRGKPSTDQWRGGDALTLFSSPLRKVQDRPGRDSHRLVEGCFSPAQQQHNIRRVKKAHTGNAKEKNASPQRGEREKRCAQGEEAAGGADDETGSRTSSARRRQSVALLISRSAHTSRVQVSTSDLNPWPERPTQFISLFRLKSGQRSTRSPWCAV
jgi:hypothetical protein